MEKAYVYLRVSSTTQVDGCGFDRQEKECRAYAKRAGYTIEGVYRELGVSGTKDETGRPAFQEMLTDILTNGVRVVIVEGLDRLARELRIQETLLVYLASKGVDLLSARTEENITQAVKDDPMRKALIQIQGVFSELEKNQLVRRMRKARDKKSADAKHRIEGPKAYGATPAERHIVNRVRAMRRTRRNGTSGMTMQAIADRLNSEGVPTRLGKRWTPVQVYNILTPHHRRRKEIKP